MNLKSNKTDIVIIIVSLLLIIAVSVTSLIINNNNKGDIVNVYYNNKIVYTMDLNSTTVWTMEKKKYSDLQADMKIETKNGKFRVAEETSKYNICSKVGWEDRPGFPVVCLPNHVMVVIEGYQPSDTDWSA